MKNGLLAAGAGSRTGDDNVSQMHYARKGLITEEMLYVADREKLTPELFAMRSLPDA